MLRVGSLTCFICFGSFTCKQRELRSGPPAQNRIVFIVVSEGHIFLSFSLLLQFLLRFNNGSHVCVRASVSHFMQCVLHRVGLNSLKSTEFTGLLKFCGEADTYEYVWYFLFYFLKKRNVSKPIYCTLSLMTKVESTSETLCFFTRTRQWKMPITRLSLDSCP
jgi:hypothetical protein